MTVNMISPISGQAGFEISNIVSGAPGPPACLILQYQTSSFGAVSKARYMKHALPKLMT
jgi:hypothetical protein